jgi:hypothetical protein
MSYYYAFIHSLDMIKLQIYHNANQEIQCKSFYETTNKYTIYHSIFWESSSVSLKFPYT